MQPQAITEKDTAILDELRAEAKLQTLETLPAFLHKLSTAYRHDYGTICIALATGAYAAAQALEKGPQGGITGFQAGAVMWEFIKQWNYSSNETGLRILDYDDVLYPQYEDHFSHQTISPGIWKSVQKLAKKKLTEHEAQKARYIVDKHAYEVAIAEFRERFPDYDQRPEYYQHLGSGTGEQWAAEDEKKKSGFEFAPREPFKPNASPNVLKHWQGIANGFAPFHMRISRD